MAVVSAIAGRHRAANYTTTSLCRREPSVYLHVYRTTLKLLRCTFGNATRILSPANKKRLALLQGEVRFALAKTIYLLTTTDVEYSMLPA